MEMHKEEPHNEPKKIGRRILQEHDEYPRFVHLSAEILMHRLLLILFFCAFDNDLTVRVFRYPPYFITFFSFLMITFPLHQRNIVNHKKERRTKYRTHKGKFLFLF